MYQCFHCGCDGVIWDSDFSFEEFGVEGEGIVHTCHCTKCNAQITYFISLDNTENE